MVTSITMAIVRVSGELQSVAATNSTASLTALSTEGDEVLVIASALSVQDVRDRCVVRRRSDHVPACKLHLRRRGDAAVVSDGTWHRCRLSPAGVHACELQASRVDIGAMTCLSYPIQSIVLQLTIVGGGGDVLG